MTLGGVASSDAGLGHGLSPEAAAAGACLRRLDWLDGSHCF